MAKLTSTQKSTGDSSSRKLRHDHSDDNEHDEDPEDGHGSGDNGDTGDDGISSNEADDDDLDDVMDREGFAGPSERVVKPLTAEGVAAFNAEIARTGVIYISRIPPGMRPEKVRHLMSQHGEVGRVYLQKEGNRLFFLSVDTKAAALLTNDVDPKVSYLRRKYTTDKKPHFVEGWVEFKDKKVARTVATMLNAQPIGGKKGTRWRDDVWTMTYLPKFKWNMLTEQIGETEQKSSTVGWLATKC